MADLQQCYNTGCGSKFNAKKNIEDICQYHPGAPVFHDAYKGWSCCKKRSTDFTEFLNIPGCSKGLHNPNKPEKEEKKVEKPLAVGEVISEGAPKMMKFKAPNVATERPSDDISKIKLKSKVASSLTMALKKHKEKEEKEKEQINGEESDAVRIGAPCKHGGCDAKNLGDDNDSIECTYHPGYAVFHEGYKFWSCCNKRTSDFNEFLKQGGCEIGKHAWMKPSEVAAKKSMCRYDWHQTGSNVLISIFAKVCDPERCMVEANPTGVQATISFNGGTDVFKLNLILNGVIDPEQSSVEYLGTKAEIKLKKKEAFSWPKLEYVSSE